MAAKKATRRKKATKKATKKRARKRTKKATKKATRKRARKSTRRKATKKGTKKGTKKATKRRRRRAKKAAAGMSMMGGNSKTWSAGEISTLRRRYRAATTSQIARELRRTLSSVKSKARALGLTKGGRRSTMTWS